MMMRVWQLSGLLLLGLVGAAGCNQTSMEEKTYSIPMSPPIDQAKQILQRYAEGNPVGSEASGFQGLVESVRATDPAKADILQKGFEEVQKTPNNPASAAKAALEKL